MSKEPASFTTRDRPGVIAPPPLLYVGTLALGFALGALIGAPSTGLPPLVRVALAAASFATGSALAIGALRRFKAAGTNVLPTRPATAVVVDGVYRLTRNPMYLAATLLYLTVALMADSLTVLILLLPLLAVMRYGVIGREERYLEAKFGDEYRRYRGTVRRWI